MKKERHEVCYDDGKWTISGRAWVVNRMIVTYIGTTVYFIYLFKSYQIEIAIFQMSFVIYYWYKMSSGDFWRPIDWLMESCVTRNDKTFHFAFFDTEINLRNCFHYSFRLMMFVLCWKHKFCFRCFKQIRSVSFDFCHPWLVCARVPCFLERLFPDEKDFVFMYVHLTFISINYVHVYS